MSHSTRPFRHLLSCLFIGLFCFLTIGCTTPTDPTAPPTPSAVVGANPTTPPVSEEVTPTEAATAPEPTAVAVEPTTAPVDATVESGATPSPVSVEVMPTVPVTTVAQCEIAQPPEMGQPLTSLPDLSTLTWEPMTLNGQPVRVLSGLGLSPTDSTVSPSGEQIAVSLQFESDFRAAIAVIGLNDSTAWWATQNTFISLAETRAPLVVWSAAGDAVWADEAGMVYMGNGDDAASLNAPVPMSQVIYVVGDVAFALSQAESALWRVDTASATWEAVTTEAGEPVMTGSLYTQLSQDSSYLLVAESAAQLSLLRVPTSMGAAATRVTATIDPYNVVGSGRPPSRPVQVGTSNIWLIDLPLFPTEPLEVGDMVILEENFAIDSVTGERVTLTGLPIPAEYDFLQGFTLSDDGAWIALSLVSRASGDTGELRQAIYVTRADAWTEGQVIEGVSVVDVLAKPATLLVQNPADGVLQLYALPLTAEATPITLNEATLGNSANVLATAPNRIYTYSTVDPSRILAFDGAGTAIGSLTLTPPYSKVVSTTANAARLFVGVAQPDSDSNCLYDLVEWQP